MSEVNPNKANLITERNTAQNNMVRSQMAPVVHIPDPLCASLLLIKYYSIMKKIEDFEPRHRAVPARMKLVCSKP